MKELKTREFIDGNEKDDLYMHVNYAQKSQRKHVTQVWFSIEEPLEKAIDTSIERLTKLKTKL